MTSREVARTSRRLADQQSAKLAAIPAARLFFATVVSSAPGGSDGNWTITINWKGTQMKASGYPAYYSAAANDRVLCALVDGQPEILHHSIGHP